MIEYISNLSNIVVGVLGLLIAFYTLIVNKNSIFKNSLQNKQLEEIEKIRKQLFSIAINVLHSKRVADNAALSNMNLEEIERSSTSEWKYFTTYRDNSLELFYSLALKDYYLIPEWVSKEKISAIHKKIEKYQPFTLHQLINMDIDIIKKYSNDLLSFVLYLDEILKRKI